MKTLTSWIRFGSVAILLTALGVIATAQTSSPEWLSLCSKCLSPSITSKSGIGTSHAVAEARISRADAEAWCQNWQPGDDLKSCVKEQLASEDAKKTYRATADCTQGHITPIDGKTYTLAGVWDSSDIGAGRTKWRDTSGQVVGRDNASGGLGISQQWEVLCPGPLKVKANASPAGTLARAQGSQRKAASPEPLQVAAPVEAPPQNPSLCGGLQLCAETSDFVAIITDFRTSTGNGFKVIDAVVRFQNKTSQPLILGYVDGSASATDDQGNRYVLSNYGTAGLRGMGVIRGQSLDAKFVLQPGGAGDARFELLWRPGREIQGTTFALDISVREANPVQGSQFTLGGEFPLHYENLTNGMKSSGVAPAAVAAAAVPSPATPAMPATPAAGQPACDPNATAAAVADTATAVAAQHAPAGAAAAISSIGGLFKHKKAAAQANAGTPAAVPCPQAAAGVAAITSAATSAMSGASASSAASGAITSAISGGVGAGAAAIPAVASAGGASAIPAVMNSSVVMGNPCAGRQRCTSAGPFAAEISSIIANSPTGFQHHVIQLNVSFHNVSNQPIILAYKAGTSSMTDNLGHGYYWGRPSTHDTSSSGIGLMEGRSVNASFVLNPGQSGNAAFSLNAFDRGSRPVGSSFNYSVVIEQLQVMPSGQVQPLREYPLNFPGITLGVSAAPAPVASAPVAAAPAAGQPAPAAAAPAAKTPAKAAAPAAKKSGAAPIVPKKPVQQ